MSQSHTDLCMIQVQQVVRIAALPAEQQIARLKGTVVADEIALDFDHCCSWALTGSQRPTLADEQRERLVALDKRFDEMSARSDPELWTENAVQPDSPRLRVGFVFW